MVEIDTLFQTKTAKKTIPFGAAHTYIAFYKEVPPPPQCEVAPIYQQSFKPCCHFLIELKLV